MFEDTPPASLKTYIDRLRAMSLIEKARAMDGMHQSGRHLGLIGQRINHPLASEDELRVRVFVRAYGRELARILFGAAVPDDAR